MTLVENTQKYIVTQNLFQKNETILVATSGGVDSVVLCNILYKLGYTFAIAHCNFKLRGAASDTDEIFVKTMAETFKVPFHVIHFDTKQKALEQKTSIEETARNLRYNWFKEIIVQCNYTCVATAHHADDNIETVVMNFFRGTGIMGLKGILPKNNSVVRPLLFWRKAAILAYAKENNLAFVEDITNAEEDYTRNFFRNNILPQIEKVYPEVDANVLKNIDRFGDTAILYTEKITEVKATLIEKRKDEIYIPVLKLLKQKALHTIVYEIIKEYNFTAHQTPEVLKLLKADSGKFILSTTHRILKNRNWIIISPIISMDNQIYLIEKLDETIVLPIGSIKISVVNKAVNFDTDKNTCFINLDEIAVPLIVRKWKTGDYFYPLGMQKKKKLSRFFIDQKLALIEKEKIWVVESNKKIVWIIGLRIDDRFKIKQGSNHLIAKITLI